MSDIELVIKIPEKEYENICLMSKDGIGMALYDWVANGKPLPKGHGRLIDESQIQKCGWDYISHHAKTNAPTIIEADKEKSDPWEKWLYPNRKENK